MHQHELTIVRAVVPLLVIQRERPLGLAPLVPQSATDKTPHISLPGTSIIPTARAAQNRKTLPCTRYYTQSLWDEEKRNEGDNRKARSEVQATYTPGLLSTDAARGRIRPRIISR